MNESIIKLTVFYEGPYWVEVFERVTGRRYSACRVVFGTTEPKNHEVDRLLAEYHMLSFSAPIFPNKAPARKKVNPKRMQRIISLELNRQGISTKAQEAIQKQWEENKRERKILSRAEREARKSKQFALRQLKKKEKHRGH